MSKESLTMNKEKKGFTLFVAIMITGTLLLVATGIVNLAVKQSIISHAARESQHAFYAADTGIECALHWDVKNPNGQSAFSPSGGSANIDCNGKNITVSGPSPRTFTLDFLPDPYCAVVTVSKTPLGAIPNIVAHWALDDGSGVTAVDSSGNGNNGTLTGGPLWVSPGQVGSAALSLDGTNDYINVGNGASLNPLNQITIAAWVRTTSSSITAQNVVDKTIGGNSQYVLRLQNGRPRFLLLTGSGLRSLLSNTTLSADTWHHVAVTYDGATMNIYINGGPPESLAHSGTMSNNAAGVRIGGTGSSLQLSGVVDDVRIYDRALTALEISSLHGMLVGGDATTVESRGYNTCDPTNPRRVERAVRASY